MLVHIRVCSALVPVHLPQHHLVGRYLVVVVPFTYYYVTWIRVAIEMVFPDSRSFTTTVLIYTSYNHTYKEKLSV